MTLPPVGITPYIKSIESFHPNIQYELLRRTKSSEMAVVYMPFVKLTSLSNVLGDNLKNGIRCQTGDVCFPSLGVHGQKEVSFDEIYTPTANNRSIIGYASGPITNGTIGRIPVLVSSDDAENDPQNIPMPGIVNLQTERSTAGSMGVRGGLFKATINIKAYSTGQVNGLLRYFLRPATRVILEIGHQPSNIQELESVFGTGKYQKFDWNRPKEQIDAELKPLVTLTGSQKDFIEKYIYGNFGNYEIFIGYVVDFKLKYNKDNTYDIGLTIHSLQQYEIPTANTGVQSINSGAAVPDKCKNIEIREYFKPSGGFKQNSFSELMARVMKGEKDFQFTPVTGDNWKDHVIPLRGPGSSPGAGGNEHPGYLVSWQFFVDVILNDVKWGILSVFQQETDSNTMNYLRASVIRSIGYESVSLNKSGEVVIDPIISLQSNEVAWSEYLRSTKPDVMVIYNSKAQNISTTETTIEIVDKLERLGTVSEEEADRIEAAFKEGSTVKKLIKDSPVGDFKEIQRGTESTGTSYLTNGVWLNTNAIIQAFEGADTISVAIDNLLKEMNNATKGFWNLQLLSDDTQSPGMHIIDMGLSKKLDYPEELTNAEIFNNDLLNSVSSATINADVHKLGQDISGSMKPTYMYVFNRGLGTYREYDTGGELLDISLESSLPQVIAVQAIAGIGGQMQRGTLEAIDINELQLITRYDVYPKCNKSDGGPCPDSTDRNLVKPPSGLPSSTNLVTSIRNLIENGRSSATESINKKLTKEIGNYLDRQIGTCEDEDETKRKQCEQRKRDAEEKINQYVRQLRAVITEQEETNRPGYLSLVGKYGSAFGSVLDLVEYDVTKLIKELDKESTEKVVHPFNSSNLTKTIVDLTMPGLGGLQLFQSFRVARVPSIVNRGYYVVTKITHDFSDNGWITKVQGRFRYNPNLKVTGPPLPSCRKADGTCVDAI